jgi:hypothetical protein
LSLVGGGGRGHGNPTPYSVHWSGHLLGFDLSLMLSLLRYLVVALTACAAALGQGIAAAASSGTSCCRSLRMSCSFADCFSCLASAWRMSLLARLIERCRLGTEIRLCACFHRCLFNYVALAPCFIRLASFQGFGSLFAVAEMV